MPVLMSISAETFHDSIPKCLGRAEATTAELAGLFPFPRANCRTQAGESGLRDRVNCAGVDTIIVKGHGVCEQPRETRGHRRDARMLPIAGDRKF
jgi:hypothetical protein